MTVKGTIGQEDVILEDAATEATLKSILAAIQGGGMGGGGGAGGGPKQAQQKLLDLAKQTGKTSKTVKDFEEDVENAGNALTRGFGHIGQGLSNIAMEFMSGTDRLSEFSQHITGVISNIPIIGGMLGGGLQLLTSVVDQQIDVFRDMSKVGAGFGNDLMATRLAAANAGLQLDTFTGIITQNLDNLNFFAGSASEASRRFANISGQVQKNQMQFSRLGMTMEEVGQYTADYIALQARSGRAQRMTDAQLAAGTQGYIKNLDQLARMTGKQRDEIAAELKSQAEDDRINLLFASLDAGAQQNIQNVLSMVGDASPEMKNALTEMIATGGAPLTMYGAELVNANSNLAAAAQNLKNNAPGAMEEFLKEMDIAVRNSQNAGQAHLDTLAVSRALGNEYGAATSDMVSMNDNMLDRYLESQRELNAQTEDTKLDMTNFESAITKIKNTIQTALIDSGIFTLINTEMSKFTAWLSGPEALTAVQGAIQPFVDFFKGFIADFNDPTKEPMAVIKEYLNKGLSKLGELIKPLIASAFSGLGSMIMGAIFGGGSSDETSVPGGPPGSGDESSGAGSGGIFVGLDGALEKLATMVAVGGTVYLAIKGFQMLLGGFSAPNVILGAGVLAGLLIGTGAAIALAGQGISSAGDGIEKMATGVERMAAVKDTANLKDVAVALGDLGKAMIALTAGGVLDSIMSFFGADSPFEKLVKGINEFSQIDATAVSNLTASSSGLANLKAFTEDLDADGVRNYARALRELTTAMKQLNTVLADQNTGRKESGYAVADMLKSGALGGGGGISNSGMSQLIDLMRENNRITDQIRRLTGDTL